MSAATVDVPPVAWFDDLCESEVIFAANRQLVVKPIWLYYWTLSPGPLATEDSKYFIPSVVLIQILSITKQVEATLSTRQRNTHTVIDTEEADLILLVAAHQGENDNFILFTLVGIDRDDVENSVAKGSSCT